MTQNFKPADFSLLTPSLVVIDIVKSIDFYKNAFGFAVHDGPMEDDKGVSIYAAMVRDGSHIMLLKQGAMDSKALTPQHSNVLSPIGLYIYVPDVDSFCSAAADNGAKVVSEPTDMFWGDRMCCLQDNDGYDWSFATLI